MKNSAEIYPCIKALPKRRYVYTDSPPLISNILVLIRSAMNVATRLQPTSRDQDCLDSTRICGHCTATVSSSIILPWELVEKILIHLYLEAVRTKSFGRAVLIMTLDPYLTKSIGKLYSKSYLTAPSRQTLNSILKFCNFYAHWPRQSGMDFYGVATFKNRDILVDRLCELAGIESVMFLILPLGDTLTNHEFRNLIHGSVDVEVEWKRESGGQYAYYNNPIILFTCWKLERCNYPLISKIIKSAFGPNTGIFATTGLPANHNTPLIIEI